MKRFYKLFACWVSVLLLVFSSGMQSLASSEPLLISTDSNTLMTMDFVDDDYSVSLMSSVASVYNTINWSDTQIRLYIRDTELNITNNINVSLDRFGSFDRSGATFVYSLDGTAYDSSKYTIVGLGVRLSKINLPNAGTYLFSWDVSSAFGYDVTDCNLFTSKSYLNADSVSKSNDMINYCVESSGDFAVLDYPIDFTNVDVFLPYYYFNSDSSVRNVDIRTSISFVPSTVNGNSVAGNSTISDNYDSEISNSLSDLSSSVESVEEEISLVTQAIQTLQGAMEPHYDNVLTQLHHITEQLHAFYDQVYNNIHLPELDMLTQIRTAIENIDLQFEVDISEVKTAINNMSTAVQNKLQSTTDQITGGYDNSQQTQQNQQLQDSINAYDEVEEDIFEDVDGFMQEFEYPSFDSMNGSVIKALAFIGGFLQSIFLSMGDFGTIITFSLTMIFVMIIVGYHRIRS